MPTRREVLQAMSAGLGAVLATPPAAAQAAWAPSKPVDFLVMAGKGGGADQAVRFMVKTIAERGWAPAGFEVRNMPGQSGLEALSELARRPRDPHVLLFTLNSFYTAPFAATPQLDVTRFAPIARMAEDNFLLWVNTRHTAITTLAEFVEAVRAAGRSWVLGGTGRDSEDQLLCDFLNVSYDLKMTYKSYGGGGTVAKALAADEVQATVNNPSEALDLMKQGKVKPLVSFSPGRLAEFRTIPALRETGMSFTYSMQRSVVGAAELPAAGHDYHVALFRKVFDDEAWQRYRTTNSLFGEFLTGAPLTAYWAREREKHKRWLAAMRAMRG